MEETTSVALRRLTEELYELFNARELDVLLERCTADIEWDWTRSLGPDDGMYVGPAAVRRFVCSQFDHWDEIAMTPEEIVEAGDEVVVFVHVRLRGRDGIEVEARGPHVLTWQDGLLARYRLFQERHEALAAVGL